ncbi:MAG TPA: hypothetical protein VHC18_11250 [Amycolatopsis sp.]|nr:hypothetical protein [Amycolatopsis sp.]
MVRTVLRSRSGDIVSAVRLADRTGIVAASAPPPIDPDETTEPVPPVLFAMPEPPSQRRRGRRNVLLACAAALFLLVGWIGGGTLGHRDPAPAVASSPIVDQVRPDQQGADVPPPASAPTPPPAVQAPAPVVETPAKRATTRKQSAAPATPDSDPPQARSEPVDVSSVQGQADTVSEQLRQMLDLWARTNALYHDSGNANGYGRYGR